MREWYLILIKLWMANIKQDAYQELNAYGGFYGFSIEKFIELCGQP